MAELVNLNILGLNIKLIAAKIFYQAESKDLYPGQSKGWEALPQELPEQKQINWNLSGTEASAANDCNFLCGLNISDLLRDKPKWNAAKVSCEISSQDLKMLMKGDKSVEISDINPRYTILKRQRVY